MPDNTQLLANKAALDDSAGKRPKRWLLGLDCWLDFMRTQSGSAIRRRQIGASGLTQSLVASRATRLDSVALLGCN